MTLHWIDQLAVNVSPTRGQMGRQAGQHAARSLQTAIEKNGAARLILASAPSQIELLEALIHDAGVDWSRVTIFHMDEYAGLDAGHPASFRFFQQTQILDKIKPRHFEGLRGEAADLHGECLRYAALLDQAPIDVVCLGIGENGHIAFNDPPAADFADAAHVKIVELDADCRQQQINDGCFEDLDAVPRHALTLTVPALMGGFELICAVPGSRKASAVRSTLLGPVAETCPATILRRHPRAALYLDWDSAALWRAASR